MLQKCEILRNDQITLNLLTDHSRVCIPHPQFFALKWASAQIDNEIYCEIINASSITKLYY